MRLFEPVGYINKVAILVSNFNVKFFVAGPLLL